jgi:hypothetical protein
LIYRGRVEVRQPGTRAAGRAERVQTEGGRAGDGESTEVDLAAMMATRAASSSSDGVPRTMLTSGSAFIDRAYDEAVLFR